jgi:hypothetical protein
MAGTCGKHRRKEKCTDNFDVKTSRKETTLMTQARLEDNIKMVLK